MDQYDSEIHHIQFLDANGEIPASLTILVRQKKGQRPSLFNQRSLNKKDISELKTELKDFKGSITPYLKK
ncbi:MAG: hypothetical protein Q7S64_02445 [bacterium]|nr:hypothetical protein [bacterium]